MHDHVTHDVDGLKAERLDTHCLSVPSGDGHSSRGSKIPSGVTFGFRPPVYTSGGTI